MTGTSGASTATQPEGVPAWVEAMQRRLAALEDERGVLDVLDRYAHAIDYGLEAEWVDCFTEDGIFDTRPGPMAGEGARQVYAVGRDELAKFISRHTRAPERWHKHILTNSRVTVHGDTADAVSYFIRVDSDETGPYVRFSGRYIDELARGGDGRWRFSHRVGEVEGTHPRSLLIGHARPDAPEAT